MQRVTQCLSAFIGLKPGQYSHLPDFQLGAFSVVFNLDGKQDQVFTVLSHIYRDTSKYWYKSKPTKVSLKKLLNPLEKY